MSAHNFRHTTNRHHTIEHLSTQAPLQAVVNLPAKQAPQSTMKMDDALTVVLGFGEVVKLSPRLTDRELMHREKFQH